eukprot:COSAG05_NODE_12500_length_465_cov_1.726776_1_plen_68_part_01
MVGMGCVMLVVALIAASHLEDEPVRKLLGGQEPGNCPPQDFNMTWVDTSFGSNWDSDAALCPALPDPD